MFGLTIDDAQYAPSANKDVGTSRIKRDKDDIQKMVFRFCNIYIIGCNSTNRRAA